MDSRLEKLKQTVEIGEIPPGACVTFIGENLPNSFPDFVKNAISKINVPLDPAGPEFKGGQMVDFNGDLVKTKYYPPDSPYTYVVKFSDLYKALALYPEVVAWFQKIFPKNVERIIFKANEVESISD